jgi:UDP-N-acetylglucosamine 2-epimerase (non-hydrolysing)
VPEDRIHVTGNTVVDALLATARTGVAPGNPKLRALLDGGRPLVLLTAHRRESFGEPLREVFRAVRDLADRNPSVEVLYPVHPNPNVVGPAREILGEHPRIHLTEPLDYLDLVLALEHATLVLTDSGGIQEEAPTFGAPVLVLRKVTERPEGVEAGVARLVGTDGPRIVKEAEGLLRAEVLDGEETRPRNPYGDGRAGERIADIVCSVLHGVPRDTTDWDGE